MLVSRRSILKLALSTASVSLYSPRLLMEQLSARYPEKSLSFYNIHTGERLNVVYEHMGSYRDEALREIFHILRDYRTGEMMPIDLNLLDTLFDLKQRLGSSEPFHIISGYRSHRTNDMLSKAGGGVAKNSLHLKGKAVDIRLPGTELSALRDAAQGLRTGGVGYYPVSDFVHMDTGSRIAHWRG